MALRWNRRAALGALVASSFSRPARAGDRLRLAVEAKSACAWEVVTARAYGLDREAQILFEILELPTAEEGRNALLSGAADVVIADWLWAAQQRAAGRKLQFYPHSTALSAVMTQRPMLRNFADLEGKKLAVAGDPLNLSWILLQAQALRQGVDVKKKANLSFGAPAALAERLRQGDLDAALLPWNFVGRLEARGFRRAFDMDEVERALGAAQPTAFAGYVFEEAFPLKNREALGRFLAMMRKAKTLIARDDAAFQRIVPMMGAQESGEAMITRKIYADGQPKRPQAQEERDARILFASLAEIGGKDLVGEVKGLDADLFYKGPAGLGAP